MLLGPGELNFLPHTSAMTIRTHIFLAFAALSTSGAIMAAPVTYSYRGYEDQFVVQESGTYSFVAIGASGGNGEGNPNGSTSGGAGERITGDLYLTAQTILSIVVGGAGGSGITGGGGGATFVFVGSTPYLVAGGGGGAGFNGDGSSAGNSTAGGAGMGPGAGSGGNDGSGGGPIGVTLANEGKGGGGAGFTGKGSNFLVEMSDGHGGDTAPSFAGGAGAAGGGNGGFGGGGGGGGAGGGGGGGYSGGGGGGTSGAGPTGGGYGGSFAAAGFTDRTFAGADNAGSEGLFTIELIAAAPPAAGVPEPGSLALLVSGALAAWFPMRRRRRHDAA